MNHSSPSTQHDARTADKVPSPTSALAHALGITAAGSPSKDAFTGLIQHAPSMESILKVAEAAVAAQNAAAAAAASSAAAVSSQDTSNSNIDPNLDPSLFAESNNGPSKSPNTQSLPPNKSPQVNTSVSTPNNQNATSSSSTPSTSTPTPTSSLSNNPYLSLSTNLLPRVAGSSSASPNMLMPYTMFYPPGTPVTPNSPSYPLPYNPYYYLSAPMPPAQNGMYPHPPPPPPSTNTNFSAANPQQSQPSPSDRSKPKPPQKAKRLKAHAVTTKSFSIPLVPRDKNKKPMLPLNVGIMTVISLGEVCMREHFHTERYIFPVGYEVTRSVIEVCFIFQFLIDRKRQLGDIFPPSTLRLKLSTTAQFWMAEMVLNSKSFLPTNQINLS